MLVTRYATQWINQANRRMRRQAFSYSMRPARKCHSRLINLYAIKGH